MIPRRAAAAHSRTVLLPCGKHYATLWGNANPPTTCGDCPPTSSR
ncbi:hypothetical protein [Micromonospora sp. NPDC005203]